VPQQSSAAGILQGLAPTRIGFSQPGARGHNSLTIRRRMLCTVRNPIGELV
jgi:hypothetical protein